VTLAEASRARELTCAEVRLQLAEAAEGIRRTPGEVRHHVRHCPHCEAYRTHLRSTRRGLGALALAPLGILAAVQRLLGLGGSSGAAASGGGAASAAASGGAASVAAGGLGLTGSKLIATAAVATIIGAGAGEITKRPGPSTRPEPTRAAAVEPVADFEPLVVPPAAAETAPQPPATSPTPAEDGRPEPAAGDAAPPKADAPAPAPTPSKPAAEEEAPVPDEPVLPPAEGVEANPAEIDPVGGSVEGPEQPAATPPGDHYSDDPDDTAWETDPPPTPEEPPAPVPAPSPSPPTSDREESVPDAGCATAGGCPAP
jgi:hypothetical protein